MSDDATDDGHAHADGDGFEELGVEELEVDTADAAALLDHRARLLARPAKTEELNEPFIEVITFRVAEQVIAIESRFITQVYRAQSITEISGASDFLAGVTNLQGAVLTLIDLRPIFDLPVSESDDSQEGDSPDSYVAVVGKKEAEFGIAVDQPGQLFQLKLSELLPIPAGLPTMAASFASAITAAGVLLLDGDSLMSDQRLIIDQWD